MFVFVLLPSLFYLLSLGGDARNSHLSTGRSSKHRLGIVIPFVGEEASAIPPYFELFCSTAAGSASLVDFLLIHNGVLDHYQGQKCPPNVKFISLGSTARFAEYLVKTIDHKADSEIALGGSRSNMIKLLEKNIVRQPYVLVEYKPALGYIFSEFLKDYTHWGYSDLDIVFGELDRWITADELANFDIVTYAYGDLQMLYLRGQFTFHRNDPKINMLWNSCDFLSNADQRFADIMSGKHEFHFESAEGCYSAAILEHNDIKVKYAIKAFTDIHQSDTANTHGLYVGTGRKKTRSVLYKAGHQADGRALERISDTWFEERGNPYSDPAKQLQYEVGERERIALIEKPDAQCMFWVRTKYQSRLCLNDVGRSTNLFWIKGQLYKQRYENMALPGKISSAAFFHFQEWKRNYRFTQLTSFERSGPVRTFVLTKEGVLPQYPADFKFDKHFVPSPLGINPRKWNGVSEDDRSQLSKKRYCLLATTGKRNNPACHLVASWQDKAQVSILSGAPLWKQVDIQNEVTLVLTLQVQAAQTNDSDSLKGLLDLLKMYLDRWQGQPCVLVLQVSGAKTSAIATLKQSLGTWFEKTSFGVDTTLVAAIFTASDDLFSRNALLNMAIDVVPTRWYVSGFEIERGLVIGHDTAFFAHRTAKIHNEIPGSVFVIPQFGMSTDESDFLLPSLWHEHDQGKLLERLTQLDSDSCGESEDMALTDDKSNYLKSLSDLWWDLSKSYVSSANGFGVGDELLQQRALTLDAIQLSVMRLLTEKQQSDSFFFDQSPILLTDNLGPRDGMITADIVREVEEFGGRLCYNGFRLARLATFGYAINTVPGAFALSVPSTRSKAFQNAYGDDKPLGVSRCDGCYFYDEEHEDTLENIVIDDRKRPAKTAILWEPASAFDPLFGHT